MRHWGPEERLAFKKGAEAAEAKAHEKYVASIAETLKGIEHMLERIAVALEQEK